MKRNQVAIYHDEAERMTDSRTERFYASFQTRNPAVPFVEVTVVAGSRVEAKRLAEKAVAGIGLSGAEID